VISIVNTILRIHHLAFHQQAIAALSSKPKRHPGSEEKIVFGAPNNLLAQGLIAHVSNIQIGYIES
jgi:hypothetical protein